MLNLFEKFRLLLYPFILSLITGIIITCAYLQNFGFIVTAILLLISLYIIKVIILLISSIPDKIRSINILLQKNQNGYNPVSFQKYMAAPCGRQVVKISLKKLNMQSVYPQLKKHNPIKIDFMKRTSKKVIFYKNGQKIQHIT